MPMFRFLKKLPIRTQLLLLAVSTGIIMFAIIFSIYFQVSGVVAKYNNEYTDNMMFQIKKKISYNCDIIDRLLSSMAYNRLVQAYTFEKDVTKKSLLYKDVNNFLINLSSMNEGIIDLVVLDNSYQRVYYLKGENTGTNEIIKSLSIGNSNYYTDVRVINYKEQDRSCFIIACNMYSILNNNITGEKLGIAAIVMDAGVFSLDINNDMRESATKFYLLDRNNRIYSRSQPVTTDKSTEIILDYTDFSPGRYIAKVDGDKYVINKENIPELNGKIISVVPEDKLLYDITWARKLTVSFYILSLALLSIPFMLIVKNIVSPLTKFIRFFSIVKGGNLKGLKQRISVEGYAEMEVMVGEFNGLLDEIDNLTHRLVTTSTRLYETELEKKKSELGYLKSQINPHFLYNTLEVMKGSAVDEDAPKTMSMAKALAQIFRYSVKGSDIISLREEIEIIKYYLQIQQVRFNDRFHISYEFTDDALNCPIPKMILQPIVENAIFHGLETKLGEGHLWIIGRIDNFSDLCISIKDDGAGMDTETIDQIQTNLLEEQKLARFFEDNNSSIGITNVNNRIKLIYGNSYGVKIKSMLGQGTEVILKIPAGRDVSVQSVYR
jgi:two-component system sensor histidine kinase YesM